MQSAASFWGALPKGAGLWEHLVLSTQRRCLPSSGAAAAQVLRKETWDLQGLLGLFPGSSLGRWLL